MQRDQVLPGSVRCRLQAHTTDVFTPIPRPSPTAKEDTAQLGSVVGERGVRWQWPSQSADGVSYATGSLILDSFATPMNCAGVDCASGWEELGPPGTTQTLEAWFEAPVTASYIFLLRTDVESTLKWSRSDRAEATETLISVGDGQLSAGANAAPSGAPPLPVRFEFWSSPTWTLPPPCRGDFGDFGDAGSNLVRR